MYPAPVHTLGAAYPVAAGDTLTATVTYDSGTGNFLLNLSSDHGWAFSTSQPARGAVTPRRLSAQWVAEAPSLGGHILPLTDFGSVTFSHASATDDSSHAGPIDDPAWSNDSIQLVTRALLAMPAILSDSGKRSSFTVNITSACRHGRR